MELFDKKFFSYLGYFWLLFMLKNRPKSPKNLADLIFKKIAKGRKKLPQIAQITKFRPIWSPCNPLKLTNNVYDQH
jgi:hypothetical protein